MIATLGSAGTATCELLLQCGPSAGCGCSGRAGGVERSSLRNVSTDVLAAFDADVTDGLVGTFSRSRQITAQSGDRQHPAAGCDEASVGLSQRAGMLDARARHGSGRIETRDLTAQLGGVGIAGCRDRYPIADVDARQDFLYPRTAPFPQDRPRQPDRDLSLGDDGLRRGQL